MPLRDWMQIPSLDDHLIEQPRVFLDRLLPKRYKTGGPRTVESNQGHRVWTSEGRAYPQIGVKAVAGKHPKNYGIDALRYEDMIPGCYRANGMNHPGAQSPTIPRSRSRSALANTAASRRGHRPAVRRGWPSRETLDSTSLPALRRDPIPWRARPGQVPSTMEALGGIWLE